MVRLDGAALWISHHRSTEDGEKLQLKKFELRGPSSKDRPCEPIADFPAEKHVPADD